MYVIVYVVFGSADCSEDVRTEIKETITDALDFCKRCIDFNYEVIAMNKVTTY